MPSTRKSLSPSDLEWVFQSVGVQRWEGLRNGRLLITGGTGFVGKWLVASLLHAATRLNLRCEMAILTRQPAALQSDFPEWALAPGVELIHGDVRHFEAPAGAFTHVIHAATDVATAASALDTFDTCIAGTRRVLDVALASGAQRFLMVSSGAVYGRQPTDLPELAESHGGAPDPLLPGSAYGEGKRAAEWLGSAYATNTGLQVITARCFAFVGPCLPLDKHFAVGNFLRDALADQPIVIQGDGTPFRSYLYAADMAAWLWAALLSGRSQRAYNIGGAEALSIADLARRVVAAVGSRSEIHILKSPEPGAAIERYVPDVRRIRAELELPEPIALDDALRRTAAWLRSP